MAPSRRTPLLLPLLLLAAALTLGACANDDDRVAQSPAAEATAPPTPSPTAQPSPSPAPLSGGSTEPAHREPAGGQTALLTAVRAAAQDGFDRVVFEFSGDVLPGYDVTYADEPITQDGSGEEVEVPGGAVLTVRMSPAADVDLSDPAAPRTYTGPNRVAPGTQQVTEVVRTGGFEGVLAWAIGVRSRADFKVSTLTGPPRIVVDVARP